MVRIIHLPMNEGILNYAMSVNNQNLINDVDFIGYIEKNRRLSSSPAVQDIKPGRSHHQKLLTNRQ